jgi:hypothetical protein
MLKYLGLIAVAVTVIGLLSGCPGRKTEHNAESALPLGFALVVQPNDFDSKQITALRDALASGNLVSKDLGTQWFAIEDINLWTEDPNELKLISEDPYQAYVQTGRIVDKSKNQYFLLVREKSIVTPTVKELLSATPTETTLGFPAIQLEFAKSFNDRLEANLIVQGQRRWVATIWHGKVLCTSFDKPWLRFNNFGIGRRERDEILRQIK